jgi:hypothetical protein
LKKPRLFCFLSGTLLIAIAFGCTSEKESPQPSNAQEASVEESFFYQPKPQEENKTSPTPSGRDAEKLQQELLMDDKLIKLPARFPGQRTSQVQGSIASNNANTYSIQYQTSTGSPLVHVTAARYMDREEANREIENFQEGKIVDPSGQNVQPIGHGVAGYEQRAAGEYHSSMKQDQWVLSLTSQSSENFDYSDVVRRMEEHLQHHPLPASANQGVVDVYYAPASDDATMDIRWQEGNMIYAVRTSLPPVTSLKIANSMN